MKSLKNVFWVLTILLFLISCGDETKKENETSVTKLNVESKMTGGLSDYYEVVNASLNIGSGSFDRKLLVEVKRTSKEFEFDGNDVQLCGTSAGKSNEYCISADIMGDSESPLATNLGKYGTKPFEQCLSLNANETIWLVFFVDNKDLIRNPTKAKTVKLISSFKGNVVSKVASNSPNSTTTTTSTAEWDEVLDDYEDYAKRHASVHKKSMDGEPHALGEYIDLMTKATRFSETLESSYDDLTPKQIIRMNKIQVLTLEPVQ